MLFVSSYYVSSLFQRGDLIEIISMNPSGLWKGKCESRVGNFKFINVEILPEKPSGDGESNSEKKSSGRGDGADIGRARRRNGKGPNKNGGGDGAPKKPATTRPKTVEELLKRIGLEVSGGTARLSNEAHYVSTAARRARN